MDAGEPGDSSQAGKPVEDRGTLAGWKSLALNSSSILSTLLSMMNNIWSSMETTPASSRAGGMADTITPQSTMFSGACIHSLTSPLTSTVYSFATFEVKTTPQTNHLEVYTVPPTTSYHQSASQSQPKESTPPAAKVINHIWHQQEAADKARPIATRRTQSFSQPSMTTMGELQIRFDAPLTFPSTTETAPKPCPYCPDLTPLPSPIHPHCLACEHLHLWLPSSTSTHVTIQDHGNIPSQAILDCILKVMGALWVDTIKKVYGTGFLVYHIYCDLHHVPDIDRCPTAPTLLLTFLSSCAGLYSGTAIANYASGIQAWKICPDKLNAILEGTSKLAPKSSK
ncbi:hypothetical protein PAXINDRAFT_9326 [Paxillus involutus ATCC 200175]|nr:hypothetical protein PAXINDRAFT_9326 [Paxillus involutus ATCC 200175]